jgi:hypothetical protein
MAILAMFSSIYTSPLQSLCVINNPHKSLGGGGEGHDSLHSCPWLCLAAEKDRINTEFIRMDCTGCGKLASFFHIALSAKKEVSLPHPVDLISLLNFVWECGGMSY